MRYPCGKRLFFGSCVGLGMIMVLTLAGAPRSAFGASRSLSERETLLIQHREVPNDPPGVPAEPVPGAPRSMPFRVGPFSSVQVNVDGAGANVPGDAANEPSIAVDPTFPNFMAIGWRQFDTVASDFRQAGWAYSRNGGRTWRTGTLDPGVFRSDPVLDFDAGGNLYYASLSHRISPSVATIDVFKSTDGGATWGAPVFAYGGDKEWMAIDRTGGMGQGHVYCSWQPGLGCCGSDIFTRSVDGGLTFSVPVAIPDTPIFGTLTVAPTGTLFVCGVKHSALSPFEVSMSANAQDPLQTPTFATTSVNLGGDMSIFTGPNPVGLLGQPWIAVDPSTSHLYLLCSVDPAGADPLDVHVVRSTDGGLTWSAPVRVNDDPVNNGAWQWFGTMSVAPNGRIDAVWIDTRTTGVANLGELRYSSSTDGGMTWAASQALSPVWDSFVGWPVQQKIGDYYHMISDDVGAHLAYAATLNGEQDVYYLRIGDYDCNRNGIGDTQDIADGTSQDLNGNGIPDECEVDTTPPEITIDLDRDCLWPPNHKLVEVCATVTVQDGEDPSPTFVLQSITSDEPEDGRGDGRTAPDIAGADIGTADLCFELRSERMAGGDGRVYTIVYKATDAAGNEAFATVYVRVPRDRSGDAICSAGFAADGASLDGTFERFVLVIPSRAEVTGTDASGNTVVVEEAFDATLLDPRQVYVGNTKGALRPDETLVLDVTGDGLNDLAVYYPSLGALRLDPALSPGGNEEGQLEVTVSDGPVGLHYRGADATDYLVPNIYALGAPVPLFPVMPPMVLADPGKLESPKTTGLTTITPNPFNPTTRITFELASDARVELRVYDVSGALVRTLRNERMPAGVHDVEWDGRDEMGRSVSTGVYFVGFAAGDVRTTRKAVLLK